MNAKPKNVKTAGQSSSTRATPSKATKNQTPRPALRLDRIMVPVDFSDASKKALSYAVSLAGDYHAAILMIHVVEDRLADPPILAKARRALKSLAEQAVQGGAPVRTLLKVGEFIDEIVREATNERIDLLLISTHSRADTPASGLGSAAEQVVRKAPCPVLVVRETEHDFLPRPATRSGEKRR